MFRVRNPEDSSTELKYHEGHLARLKGRLPKDLWRYFSKDFFHDGRIGPVTTDLPGARVVFEIACPNIRRGAVPDHEFISMKFRCEFREVLWFQVIYSPSEVAYPGFEREAFQFLYAEINGEKEALSAVRQESEEDVFSLGIQTDSPEAYIVLIFKDLRVEPLEPGAFALMAANPDYEIPLA